jgi:hypothetical protein
MIQPVHSRFCRQIPALLALSLAWPRLLSAASPTAQALYRPAAVPPPIQILWNNGSPWSWDGARLSLSAEAGVGLEGADEGHAKGSGRALALSADAPCLKGCDADLLRLELPGPADPTPYLAQGHIQFEMKRYQAISGTLLIRYGGSDPCRSATLPLASVKLGAYTHVSLPLAAFGGACPGNGRMTVPFRLSLKGARYNAGPMLAFKFIRWTPD